MTDSILQVKKECYVCGRQYGLEKHHILGGIANRKRSDALGIWVWLCHSCHTGDKGAQYERELNQRLKMEAQEAFEKKYSHEKWMETFMKNYL